jgi:hypothetical protein
VNKLDVIRHFSGSPGAPVDIEDHILPFLQQGGLRDELYLREMDVDDSKLRGKLVHWEPWEYKDDWATDFDRPRLCADIFVAKNLDAPWRRVIVCKELLHVLDPPESRVSSTEEVERLVRRIVLPLGTEMIDSKTLTDMLGLYEALAVLFPWRVREALMSRYLAGTLLPSHIATYVEIPLQYVHLVMSETWPKVHDAICPS